jgi:tetratricopeptide (TPR) repeat protein
VRLRWHGVVYFWLWLAMLVAGCWTAVATAEPLSREKALLNLGSAKQAVRQEAVVRLGEIGRMRDGDKLAPLLFDDDEEVRAAVEASLWRVWSKSGDRRVDALYKKGLGQMNSGDAEAALATFSEVIRIKSDFAEGWNKRATLYYFLGRYKESIADCEEVLKRNPHHFGALSGFGQNYGKLENFEKALEYFERALAINPNMQGVALNIVGLRKLLSDKAKRAI